jgi:hypothetical protein
MRVQILPILSFRSVNYPLMGIFTNGLVVEAITCLRNCLAIGDFMWPLLLCCKSCLEQPHDPLKEALA